MQAAVVNSASADAAEGLSAAVFVSHVSRGMKRQSLDVSLPESVATDFEFLQHCGIGFTHQDQHMQPLWEKIFSRVMRLLMVYHA